MRVDEQCRGRDWSMALGMIRSVQLTSGNTTYLALNDLEESRLVTCQKAFSSRDTQRRLSEMYAHLSAPFGFLGLRDSS